MSASAATRNTGIPPRKIKKSSESGGWGNPIIYFIALCLIALVIAPIVYIILSGFRSNSQLTNDPAGFPNPWVTSNYSTVASAGTFWRDFANSVICAVATTIGVVVFGIMASYVIARYKFRGRGAMYTLFAAGLMFPLISAITPLYMLIKDIHLLGTLPGVFIPGIAYALPTTVIILVPFLNAIPKEMEEAASIDGCSRLGFFSRMVLPLSMPGVITVGILAFIGSWNGYVLPLYVLSDPSTYTLPLGVSLLSSSQYSSNTALMLAFTSLAMIPALVFFSIFQKRIVGGLTGAVKG